MIKILFLLLIGIGAAMRWLGPSDSLDAHFYYTSEYAQIFLTQQSAEEANAYFINELIDLSFLATYSALFFLLFRRYGGSKRSWLAFIPGIFDLIETVTILSLLRGWATVVPWWLGFATALKWVTATLAIVGVTLLFCCQRLYDKRRKTPQVHPSHSSID